QTTERATAAASPAYCRLECPLGGVRSGRLRSPDGTLPAHARGARVDGWRDGLRDAQQALPRHRRAQRTRALRGAGGTSARTAARSLRRGGALLSRLADY